MLAIVEGPTDEELCRQVDKDLQAIQMLKSVIEQSEAAGRLIKRRGRAALAAMVAHVRGHQNLDAPNLREAWGRLFWYLIHDIEGHPLREYGFTETDRWVARAERIIAS